MARLITIQFQSHNEIVEGSTLTWVPSLARRQISNLPQIVWADGSPFREANIWAHARASNHLVNPKTVESNMAKLLTYANFLETHEIDLWHFPRQRKEQALIQYRGYLVDCRNRGEISPSGASHRMRVVVKFYRFLYAEGLIDSERTLWKERRFTISTYDAHGFERTVIVNTTDLAIPNRRRGRLSLEDGLMPLSETGLKELLHLSRSSQPIEFFLMVLLGVFCGLRIGTISDIKTGTLLNAAPDPASPGSRLINVGPGACPPVATKNGVNGQVSIPETVFKRVMTYATSSRRSRRLAIASPGDADLVFLTTRGKPYCNHGTDSSGAIRTLTRNLRLAAEASGNSELSKFKFHQTRATFATRLTAALLEKHNVNNVLAFVKRAMLHSKEATTLLYIRFVEQHPLKSAAADAFTRDFMGTLDEAD